ncbi:MAG: hypothetical protein M1823_002669 [Watsoniomyces obsoletus]|nr:MAG: hypothetical protein M1823_002669 [Watsoniomyces obsoletus]
MELPHPELPSWDRAQARQSHPDLPSSILEPAITTMLRKTHSHNQHNHRHHHHHHHHMHPHLPHRHHRHKEKEKEKEKDAASGSNVSQGGDGNTSRAGGHVRNGSTNPTVAASQRGRRPSVEDPQSGTTNDIPPASGAERTMHMRRRWMNHDHEDGGLDITRLEEERGLREEALTNTLSNLSDFSNKTIRTLDERYYSFLETLSKLQGTIVSLQGVSRGTEDLRKQSEVETHDVESETETHLAELKGFNDHRSKIEGLGGKVKAGREKVVDLSTRLEKLRDMVEEWERKEKEWQVKVRRRLRILWILASFGIILFIVLYFRHHHQPNLNIQSRSPFMGIDHQVGRQREGQGQGSKQSRFLDDGGRIRIHRESNSGSSSTSSSIKIREQEMTKKKKKGAKKGDDILRLFDEL